jgi:hypothetical protein
MKTFLGLIAIAVLVAAGPLGWVVLCGWLIWELN